MTSGTAESDCGSVTGASATVRSTVDHPEVVAAALRPDDTDALRTAVADGAVTVSVERGDVGGLAATLDDVLVNLRVADRVSTEAFDDAATELAAADDPDAPDDRDRRPDGREHDRPTDDATAIDDTNDTDTP